MGISEPSDERADDAPRPIRVAATLARLLVRAPREPSHALYFKRLHRDLDSMHCLRIPYGIPRLARRMMLLQSIEPIHVTDRR